MPPQRNIAKRHFGAGDIQMNSAEIQKEVMKAARAGRKITVPAIEEAWDCRTGKAAHCLHQLVNQRLLIEVAPTPGHGGKPVRTYMSPVYLVRAAELREAA